MVDISSRSPSPSSPEKVLAVRTDRLPCYDLSRSLSRSLGRNRAAVALGSPVNWHFSSPARGETTSLDGLSPLPQEDRTTLPGTPEPSPAATTSPPRKTGLASIGDE